VQLERVAAWSRLAQPIVRCRSGFPKANGERAVRNGARRNGRSPRVS